MLATCRRAAKLPGAPPHILLLAAHALLGAGERAEAVGLLTRAEAKLGPLPEGWLYVAELELEAGACSAAEASAARAKQAKLAEGVAQECRKLRNRIGFPPGAALTPEQESGYVAAALAAHRKIDERKLDAALLAAATLRSAFPAMPAGAVAECRARSRTRDLPAIRRVCAEAAAAAPDAFYPRYVAGLLASGEGHWPEAASSLQRAVELDDSGPQVWQSLAAVEQKLHDEAAVRDLTRRFRAKFNAQLRPALWPAGWVAR
jgi:predicted Zn-dependent protease